jgi:hypothetical protein
MTTYIRHEGQAALDWANQHSFAHWMVWRYERLTRMLVISCWQGDPQEEIGFLVLRGIQAVDIMPYLGQAIFALETIQPENPYLKMDQDAVKEAVHIMKIAGDDQNSYVLFRSFSLYEMPKEWGRTSNVY